MSIRRFPVEAGHIMMFARAIGDPNPIYTDEAYARESSIGHIIAPPTFIQAAEHFDPDYDRRPSFGKPWFGSGREAVGASGGSQPGKGQSGFHAEQHFTYVRHLQPGDALTAHTRPGRRWEREGRRGGKLIFTETITDYVDPQEQLLISASFVGVGTERHVGSESQTDKPDTSKRAEPAPVAGAMEARRVTAGELTVGQRYMKVVVDNLTRTQLVMYAGASGDFHPFHHDEVYARAMGQPTIFAPGMLTMALAGKLLTHLVGDGRLTHYSASFRGQVWPGDTLTAYAVVTAVTALEHADGGPNATFEITSMNQRGELVLKGRAGALLIR